MCVSKLLTSIKNKIKHTLRIVNLSDQDIAHKPHGTISINVQYFQYTPEGKCQGIKEADLGRLV